MTEKKQRYVSVSNASEVSVASVILWFLIFLRFVCFKGFVISVLPYICSVVAIYIVTGPAFLRLRNDSTLKSMVNRTVLASGLLCSTGTTYDTSIAAILSLIPTPAVKYLRFPLYCDSLK